MRLDEIRGKVKVNYDTWNTPPAKNLNDRHLAILKLMSDGQARERADMIRSATDMDPNPKSANGFAGWNKLDYDLYKKGLLDVVDVKGGKKIFKINAKGRKIALNESAQQTSYQTIKEAQKDPQFSPERIQKLTQEIIEIKNKYKRTNKNGQHQ